MDMEQSNHSLIILTLDATQAEVLMVSQSKPQENEKYMTLSDTITHDQAK
jgi:hypothetical protein